MDTRATPELFADWWETLISQEQEAGAIPLPAVDSIVLDADHLPTIWLLVPEGTPGSPSALVNVGDMGPGDRLTLEIFVRNLERLIVDRTGKVSGPLRAVWHLGGLDYEFDFADGRVQLTYLPAGLRHVAWTILRAIACIGEHNIDVEASVPRTPRP